MDRNTNIRDNHRLSNQEANRIGKRLALAFFITYMLVSTLGLILKPQWSFLNIPDIVTTFIGAFISLQVSLLYLRYSNKREQ